MKNFRIPKAISFILAAVIILILGGLAGWYFYLHAQEGATDSVDAARGLGAAVPTFDGTTGSTQADQAIASHTFGTTNSDSSSTSTSQLWEVDGTPVAGMGFVGNQTAEYLYYVERANGYVFEAHPSTESVVRLTNTLMPKIYEAQFADDGSVVERAIDAAGSVSTFLGMISTSTDASSTAASAVSGSQSTGTSSAPMSLTGVYLQPGIQAIAIDPASRALFYIVGNAAGGINAVTEEWNGMRKKQVFSSIVGSWRPYMLADGTMMLLESPADGLPGYAYSVNSAGTLTAIASAIPGLTILPKTSSSILLYGSSSGSSLSLFGEATGTPTLLPIATIADKCVWLPGSSEVAYCAVPNGTTPTDFLGNWYRGTTDTSDDWWEIDLSAGTSARIYSPSADNLSLDVEDPTIDPSGNYIAFRNAADQSLWVLRVAQ